MTADRGPLADFLAAVAAPDLAGLADGSLLARYLRDRDEAAFAELVRRHAGMTHAVARRAGVGDADAEDCAQAAFVVLARNAARLSGDATVGDWLHGVAVRVALAARARHRRRQVHERRAGRAEAVPPDLVAERTDTAAAVDRAVRALPAKLREVVVLCDLEGLTQPAAAARLGVPVGTVSGRLTVARRKLARRLARPLGLAGLVLTAGPPPAALARAVLAAALPGPRDVPAAVSTLVAEATRMMWLSKLKVAAACGAVALAAGAASVGVGVQAGDPKPPAKATAPAPAGPAARAPARGASDAKRSKGVDADYQRLAGRWSVFAVLVDGRDADRGAGGYPASLTFGYGGPGRPSHRASMSVPTTSFAGDGADQQVRMDYAVNPHRPARELTMVMATPDGGVRLAGYVYKFEGDRLWLACYRSAQEADRPRGFEVPDQPDGAPPLVVLLLERARPDPAAVDALVERMSEVVTRRKELATIKARLAATEQAHAAAKDLSAVPAVLIDRMAVREAEEALKAARAAARPEIEKAVREGEVSGDPSLGTLPGGPSR